MVSCFGIFCFFIIEVIKADAPKRPVNIGRKGSFIGRFKVAKPRKPANRKIIVAQILDFFSRTIKKKEAMMRINGIIF